MNSRSGVSLSSDFLNSRKILFHIGKHWQQVLEGKTDFNPIAVEVHPTAKCNHACVHCSYKERNANRDELSQEIMERLVHSLMELKVEAVYFSGGGEPTLYPNLARYVKMLSQAGIEVALLTNGTYFEQAGLIDIADCFNYIAFSVPGASSEVFESITGKNLLENVLSIPEKIKKKFGDRSPVLGSRIVLTNQNYKQMQMLLWLMRERKFDYALFKVVRDYEESGQGLGIDEEKYLRNEIEKMGRIDDDFTNLNYIFNYRKKADFVGNCWINQWGWLANISTDGKIYPNIVEIDQEDFCIGDLHEQPLEEIWNSARHREVKRKSQEKWLNGECKNCRAISYNSIINEHMALMPKVYDAFI